MKNLPVHQFKRTDGRGWLATGETISTYDVKIYDSNTGTETTSTMISDTGIYENTKILYKLKDGVVDGTYIFI